VTYKPPPVIGVTCINIPATKGGRPPRTGQNQAYIRSLLRAGGAPLLLPRLDDETVLRSLYGLLDGLLLPGGEDVDPACYGESRREECGPVSPDRDAQELALARWAVDEGKPVLAICRGIQVLNVALGGSLYQDIGAQLQGTEEHAHQPGRPRSFLSHQVRITPQSRLASILGATELWVNSMHHQAIKEASARLAIVAHAPDGVVEGAEVMDHPFAVAVQWHPEELADREVSAQRLFDALVEGCRA
jgi:putative glutamine amidotransferase